MSQNIIDQAVDYVADHWSDSQAQSNGRYEQALNALVGTVWSIPDARPLIRQVETVDDAVSDAFKRISDPMSFEGNTAQAAVESIQYVDKTYSAEQAASDFSAIRERVNRANQKLNDLRAKRNDLPGSRLDSESERLLNAIDVGVKVSVPVLGPVLGIIEKAAGTDIVGFINGLLRENREKRAKELYENVAGAFSGLGGSPDPAPSDPGDFIPVPDREDLHPKKEEDDPTRWRPTSLGNGRYDINGDGIADYVDLNGDGRPDYWLDANGNPVSYDRRGAQTVTVDPTGGNAGGSSTQDPSNGGLSPTDRNTVPLPPRGEGDNTVHPYVPPRGDEDTVYPYVPPRGDDNNIVPPYVPPRDGGGDTTYPYNPPNDDIRYPDNGTTYPGGSTDVDSDMIHSGTTGFVNGGHISSAGLNGSVALQTGGGSIAVGAGTSGFGAAGGMAVAAGSSYFTNTPVHAEVISGSTLSGATGLAAGLKTGATAASSSAGTGRTGMMGAPGSGMGGNTKTNKRKGLGLMAPKLEDDDIEIRSIGAMAGHRIKRNPNDAQSR